MNKRHNIQEQQLWWPIAAIEKKFSKSRKKFQNQEKNFGIHKNISESKLKKNEIEKKITESRKKNLKPREIFQNRENCFRIEK